MSNNLRLADCFFTAIKKGKKTSLILKGRFDIKTGRDNIEALNNTKTLSATTVEIADLIVDVFGYKYTSFKNLTMHDLVQEGLNVTAKNFLHVKAEFLLELCETYPEMTEDDDMTVVYFSYVTGGSTLGSGPMH